MADDVKIVVTQAAPAAEAEKPATEPVVQELCDHVAIVSFIERELLKIPGCRSKSLYCLQEGDRGWSRSQLTFKLATDYTVADEAILKPWRDAFNMRYWQHCPDACKNKTPSGWLKDNLTVEVNETVSMKYWSFKMPQECLSVMRELIAVPKGAATTGVRKVTDFY